MRKAPMLALVALTLAALPLAGAPPINHNLGEWRVGRGAIQDTFLSSCPVALQVHQVRFDATKPWNARDTRGSYLQRYGYVNEGCHDADPTQKVFDPYLLSNGTRAPNHLTAEIVLPQLRALARRADNPFGLIGWQTYEPTLQDGQDVLVGAWGNTTVWDGLIVPMTATRAAPPAACPSCPACATCPASPLAPPLQVCACAPPQKFAPSQASSGRVEIVLTTPGRDGSCSPC